MTRFFSRQWAEFKQTILTMDNASPPSSILHEILTWLRNYPDMASNKSFKLFRIDQYITLDEKNYPICKSSLRDADFEALKRNVERHQANNVDGIAMLLRDALERLLVLDLDEPCPNCKQYGLGIYYDKQDKRIAYECNRCGFAKYLDGSKVPDNRLTFATNDDLRNAGLLLPDNGQTG